MNNIRKERWAKGFKQAELAELLQIRQNTLSNWETGRTEPDLNSLRKMAEIFDVSIDYLVGKTDLSKDFVPESPKVPGEVDFYTALDNMDSHQLLEALQAVTDKLKERQENK